MARELPDVFLAFISYFQNTDFSCLLGCKTLFVCTVHISSIDQHHTSRH